MTPFMAVMAEISFKEAKEMTSYMEMLVTINYKVVQVQICSIAEMEMMLWSFNATAGDTALILVN